MTKKICVADDPVWTLKEWKEFIEDLIEEYGEEAELFAHAGYNNVEMTLRYENDYLVY